MVQEVTKGSRERKVTRLVMMSLHRSSSAGLGLVISLVIVLVRHGQTKRHNIFSLAKCMKRGGDHEPSSTNLPGG